MSEKSEKGGGGFGFWQVVGMALIIHFFVGWEWLGNLTSGQSSEERRGVLVATLDGYAAAKPGTVDLVDLGRRVPDMTDVQLSALEGSLKGKLVTARGPVYDIQAASSHLGLKRYEVVVWALSIDPVRLMVRGTCIARTGPEATNDRGAERWPERQDHRGRAVYRTNAWPSPVGLYRRAVIAVQGRSAHTAAPTVPSGGADTPAPPPASESLIPIE